MVLTDGGLSVDWEGHRLSSTTGQDEPQKQTTREKERNFQRLRAIRTEVHQGGAGKDPLIALQPTNQRSIIYSSRTRGRSQRPFSQITIQSGLHWTCRLCKRLRSLIRASPAHFTRGIGREKKKNLHPKTPIGIAVSAQLSPDPKRLLRYPDSKPFPPSLQR